jgi:hypothetical protein
VVEIAVIWFEFYELIKASPPTLLCVCEKWGAWTFGVSGCILWRKRDGRGASKVEKKRKNLGFGGKGKKKGWGENWA